VVREAAEVARGALRRAGHGVTLLDLDADGFDPVMGADDRRAYFGADPLRCPLAKRYAEAVRGADAIAFAYCSVLSTLSPDVKGWLDRVLVPGVAFTMETDGEGVRGGLRHLRRLGGIVAHEAPRSFVRRCHDNGRRVVLRNLRLCTGPTTRTTWTTLYDHPRADARDRETFLSSVDRRFGAW
jgi:putative NADPH-quinone reductase